MNNNLSANKALDEKVRGDETFCKNVKVSGDKMVARGWMV